MERLKSLQAASSLHDVAGLLGFQPKSLAYLLYKLPESSKYTDFQIPKRGGGHRTISAPEERLKHLQRRLADLLQDCVAEIVTAKGRKDGIAHGFKRQRSIISNASRHSRRRWVFNLDLEDFFPSINFGRVRGFLIKNRDFELNERVATVIAQIACHGNSLPQGSPCSPVLSNLVAHVLDMRIVKLSSPAGCSYTRYADDLSFSTNKESFPACIAVPLEAKGDNQVQLWRPGDRLKEVIERAGFRINEKKTRMMYRRSRQEVTGLIVNTQVSVRYEYRRRIRAMVHRLINKGDFEVPGFSEDDKGQPVLGKRPGTLLELQGMLGFIDKVAGLKREARRREDEASGTKGSGKRSSDEDVYRAFLMYTQFYAAPAPVVICEGYTDNVYLTHAIRSLAAEFPLLAEVLPKNEIRLKIRLYKYPRSRTAKILDLNDGGSGVLARFIHAYKKETGRFAGPGLQSPVIMLYDNDGGAPSIRNAMAQAGAKKPDGTEQYQHVLENLYAMPTPLIDGSDQSEIEDFFDDATRATVVDGKTFTTDSKYDRQKYYGKSTFAHKVVRKSADSIDFSGFRPLLTNLEAAISAHEAPSAAAE